MRAYSARTGGYLHNFCFSVILAQSILQTLKVIRISTYSMPPKKRAPKGMAKPLPPGQILIDLRRKEWKLGPLIGQGGFGYLYLGSDNVTSEVNNSAAYVIKVEPHTNGPLFVELAFYQRAATKEKISAWTTSHKQTHLGVPRFIGTGSFESSGTKYRFMIMDRFGQDVEKLFLESRNKFPLHTIFGLGLRIIEILEYLHEQEYVHADIKASNLLTGFGKKNSNTVYLVDYGLAYRYCPSGEHVAYKEDPKRKHDGTIEFTSRDAHKGLAPSRRGDLEVLSYCMLQWLCSKLPWETNLKDCNFVMLEKIKFMKDVDKSLKSWLGPPGVPEQLAELFRYVNKLEYTEKPDYDRIKKWFRDALKMTGYPDDGKSVQFDVPGKKTTVDTVPKEKSPERRAKRTKALEAGITNGEGPSPPKRQRQSNPQAKISPKNPKISSIKKPSPPKKVKRLSNGHARPKSVKSSRQELVSPKRRNAKTRVSPRVKAGGTLEQTRRRKKRNVKVRTVDFAQSP